MKLAKLIATLFFVGQAKIAPGSIASLLTAIVFYMFAIKFDYIYERHLSSEEEYTDDVNLAFLDEKKIEIICGSEYNLKITTPEDIKIAEKLFLNV